MQSNSPDRPEQEREVSATLPASYTLAEVEDGPATVYRCRTRKIALDRIAVEAETLPPQDAKVYLNISGLGVCMGQVSEILPHGFVLSIALDKGAIGKLLPRLGTLKHSGGPGEDLRVFATLKACYTIAGARTKDSPAKVYQCRTRSIALDRIVVEADALPPEGVDIYLNILGLGVCTGRVGKLLANGFVVAIALDAEIVGKLMPRLEWLKRHLAGATDNRRAHPRHPTPPYPVRLQDEEGRETTGKMQDLSSSGLAVLTQARPAIGTQFTTGGIPGRVARLFEGGLAIRFDTPRPVEDLKAQLFPPSKK